MRRILVVTEGISTEPQYIERLNNYLRSKTSTTVVKTVGSGQDPLRVVKKCIELRQQEADKQRAFDICACLVDVDQHATLDEACRLARREEILLLISNIKFEVWLRWHVEEKTSPLNTSQLDRLMSDLALLKGKSLTSSFPIDKVTKAVSTAKLADPSMAAGRVGPNPSSAMPLLVDLMQNPVL